MTASLLVRMFSHLAVSCFVHGSRQTKQPKDDMRECLCPKPSHTTVPVSLVVAQATPCPETQKNKTAPGVENSGQNLPNNGTPGDAAKQ
jgi:hypothetical protein